MIQFIIGMINTPGARAFRTDWKEDKNYRLLIKGMLIILAIEITIFYIFA